ncbi:hypothetical protein ACROYT_G017571 [Oculina patagonica]
MTGLDVSVLILLALALPRAVAISCYTCDPVLPHRTCLEPETLSNCDNVNKTVPYAIYDACMRLSLQMTYGQTTYNASLMRCYYKSLCSALEATGCGDIRADIKKNGGTLDKCKLTSCCQEDGCIGFKGAETTTRQPTGDNQCGGARDVSASFIASIASAMISLVSFLQLY